MKIEKKLLEQTDGSQGGGHIEVFELKNDNGMTVVLTNIGATIMSIRTPDKDGNAGEVVLGFDDAKTYLSEEYLKHGYFFGATVGRYANRIGGAKFSIDSKTYELEVNNGPNHLHGGTGSFNTKIWSADPFEADGRVGVKMHYVSPNMENGYPGTLTVTVVFTLMADNELRINYQATTDKKTIVNLTNHSYFNLSGAPTILDTEVSMAASRYTPMDETNIPTGEVESVKNSPMDFILPHRIGDRIALLENGYDHNYIIDGTQGELRKAAEAYDVRSGRTLTFLTTEPGFQFYTAYYLGGEYQREGLRYGSYAAFCFEAQHFPDSPNKKQFPTTVLKPGETYTQTTIYRFGVRK